METGGIARAISGSSSALVMSMVRLKICLFLGYSILPGIASANRWFDGRDSIPLSCIFGLPKCYSDICFIFSDGTSHDIATWAGCRCSGVLDKFRFVRALYQIDFSFCLISF